MLAIPHKRAEAVTFREVCRAIIEAGLNGCEANRDDFISVLAKHLGVGPRYVKDLLEGGARLGYWTMPNASVRAPVTLNQKLPRLIRFHVPDTFDISNERVTIDTT